MSVTISRTAEDIANERKLMALNALDEYTAKIASKYSRIGDNNQVRYVFELGEELRSVIEGRALNTENDWALCSQMLINLLCLSKIALEDYLRLVGELYFHKNVDSYLGLQSMLSLVEKLNEGNFFKLKQEKDGTLRLHWMSTHADVPFSIYQMVEAYLVSTMQRQEKTPDEVQLVRAMAILDTLADGCFQDPSLYVGGRYEENMAEIKQCVENFRRILQEEKFSGPVNPFYDNFDKALAKLLVLAQDEPDIFSQMFAHLFTEPLSSVTGMTGLNNFLNAISDDHEYRLDLSRGLPVVQWGDDDRMPMIMPNMLYRALSNLC